MTRSTADDRPNPLPGSPRDWLGILDEHPDAILIADATGFFTYANDAAVAMIGRGHDEIIGRSCTMPGWCVRRIDGARDAAADRLPFGLVFETGQPLRDAVLEFERPDGSTVIASANVAPVRNRGGIGAVLASLRDITRRHRAEQNQKILAEAGRLLAASLEYEDTLRSMAQLAVPAFADWCVVDVVESGRVRRAGAAHARADSETAAELARLEPPSLDSGHAIVSVLRTGHPYHAAELDLAGQPIDAEKQERLRRLGLRSVICVPVVARAEVVAAISFIRATRTFDAHDLAFAQEVASYAAAAIDNARLFEQAQESSRTKSTFIGVMSHEFRTPLTTIAGYADLLCSGIGGPLSEKQQEQIGRIRASAWHLTQLVDEILSFSRVEAGREEIGIEPFDAADLTRRVAALLEPSAAAKGIALRVEVDAPRGLVATDPQKVRQILFNLLSNAVRFTDHGEVRLRCVREPDSLVFSVTDTGIGIAPENHERIFESFWQVEQGLSRRTGGTGLGLAITRRLARMLGGDVTVRSKLGEGATFVVRLAVPAPGAAVG